MVWNTNDHESTACYLDLMNVAQYIMCKILANAWMNMARDPIDYQVMQLHAKFFQAVFESFKLTDHEIAAMDI